MLSPNQRDAPKVQVSTFAVDGIQANDMMVVQRIKPDKDGTNTLLYMPERSGPSFREFKNTDAMNSWLRDTAADPRRLARFSRHFSDGVFPKRTEHVQEKMRQFQQGDGNAVVGAFGQESDDIFARLNRKSTAPPVPVNGLSDLQFSYEAPEGGHATYNGRRPDGETVHYQYDPYGNFIGEAGNQKEFYFQKNGLNSFEPLSPLTKGQFDKEIKHAVENNVARTDTGGLFNSLIKTLKNPAHSIGSALQTFGIPENTANAAQRYLDNPLSAALTDLNKDNQIGAVFGVDRDTMDGYLKSVGEIGQGFVPFYGQARGGYNVETATFQAMVKSPHAGQPESKLSVTGFFATEDIPAGTELRWNYRYDDASMKLLFGGRGPASKDVRST